MSQGFFLPLPQMRKFVSATAGSDTFMNPAKGKLILFYELYFHH